MNEKQIRHPAKKFRIRKISAAVFEKADTKDGKPITRKSVSLQKNSKDSASGKWTNETIWLYPHELPALIAVVHAVAIAFGFVFMHPFEDGNGRIHRFLIHNILARRGFTPEGIIFPISAAMLNNMAGYDAALESFSKPLIPLIDYTLDENGQMKVNNQTVVHYRYPDMTVIAEVLFAFIQTTIEKELVEELNFLKNYDVTKRAIQAIVDMPDNRIDLFIRFCLQNNGVLSPKKRTSHFTELTDEEVAKMQDAVQKAYRTKL